MQLDGTSKRLLFEDFTSKLDRKIALTLTALREAILELGNGVVEDVRMHRIVYGRGDTLRMFLDIQPTRNGLILTFKKGKNFSDQNNLTRTANPGWVEAQIVSLDNKEQLIGLLKNSFESV